MLHISNQESFSTTKTSNTRIISFALISSRKPQAVPKASWRHSLGLLQSMYKARLHGLSSNFFCCRELKEAVRCIHSYTRLCMNLDHRKHFKMLFHGTASMVRHLCNNGTYQEGVYCASFMFHTYLAQTRRYKTWGLWKHAACYRCKSRELCWGGVKLRKY